MSVKTVSIEGPLDAQHLQDTQDKIDAVDLQVGDEIVLDCTNMNYICSSGLRIFLGTHKDAAQRGAKMIVKGLQPLVKNIFDLTGFSQVFAFE